MTGIHVIQTIASIAESTGGPARTIRSLCEALARQGAEVELLTGDDPDAPALLQPDPALVTTHFVQRRGALPPYGFGAALKDAPAGSIVHDNGLWNLASLSATRAARRAGLPYVISPHGMLEPWALARRATKKRLAWAMYQRGALAGARGLVASSEGERLGIRHRVQRLPVAVIANGVDIPAAVPAKPRDGAGRTLLFLSRLHPVKNLLGLVRAWAIVAADARFDDWRLQIAGPDEAGHRADVEALIAKLGLGARIALTGPVAEAAKSAAFAAAELFILPSHMESFGVVAAEALAHGVPVIASTGTPWSELRQQGCGWQAAPDPASLATAMAEAMMQPPAALAAMGAKGRAYVAASFGWDRIAGQTLDYYRWLLNGGAVPDFVDV